LSNTINKKPCKNTTQAGTNHKILLNSFFLYKNPMIFITFFYQKYIFIVIFSPNLYNTKIWQEYSYTSIVQYSQYWYFFLYEYCGQYSYTSIVVAKFKWSSTKITNFMGSSTMIVWVKPWLKSWLRIWVTPLNKLYSWLIAEKHILFALPLQYIQFNYI